VKYLKGTCSPADNPFVLQKRWWLVPAGAIAVVLVVYGVVLLLTSPGTPVNAFFTLWVYQGLIILSVVVAGARAIMVRRDRMAWSVLTLSLASTSFAELYVISAHPTGYPSVADFGWLAFYPLAYVGMALLIRRRARSIGATIWLDAVTASTAAAALGAAVLVELVLQSTSGSFAAVATNLAYPIGDVLLLSVVFGVFSLSSWRVDRQWLVLGLGLLATTIADAIYLFEVNTYQAGEFVDILWPISTLLIAAAAWVPESKARRLEVEGKPLLAVPAVCALIGMGILVYDHFSRLNVLAIVLASATLLVVVMRLASTFRENQRLFDLTREESITDALTGLYNRRKLVLDLERRLDEADAVTTLLMLFDLDGFKGYNDSFGHPAGDALLARLGAKLAKVPGDRGAAYRLGGDEFCLVATIRAGDAERLIDRACNALSERGEGFEVSSSFGAVLVPDDATDPSEALRMADERLYAQKHSRRAEGDRTMHALLEALTEREPELLPHLEGVAALAVKTGRMLGLRRDELQELSKAAQLHDLGKLAVPDEILHKRGPLDEREWEFIHQHTLVGERILRASPAYQNVATIVRSSHERWDGRGYPDGLEGEAIPLASRIICACDAYDAMISDRPYRPALKPVDALAEIERNSGSMFDPTVARVLVAHVRDQLEAERAA
jgi:two-component system cell cycle response regulator